MKDLVSWGTIHELHPIPNSDFIVQATVVCGHNGKWRGVVRKEDFKLGDKCVVYMPDAVVPPNEHMHFLANSNWRVRMAKFRGCPSEVVIMPNIEGLPWDGVHKYEKPLPANMHGKAKDYFPSFIPKTDEPNWQVSQELIEALRGQPYYISEKLDGCSSTAFVKDAELHVCSRNLELSRNKDNGYWEVALRYRLDERLPPGIALQWETCGPKIQRNPLGLEKIDGFAFSAYNWEKGQYLEMKEFQELCEYLQFPRARVLEMGDDFAYEDVSELGVGQYPNGKDREGVVIRSQFNINNRLISFKVINLNYDK